VRETFFRIEELRVERWESDLGRSNIVMKLLGDKGVIEGSNICSGVTDIWLKKKWWNWMRIGGDMAIPSYEIGVNFEMWKVFTEEWGKIGFWGGWEVIEDVPEYPGKEFEGTLLGRKDPKMRTKGRKMGDVESL
jgi:hypothetical protein